MRNLEAMEAFLKDVPQGSRILQAVFKMVYFYGLKQGEQEKIPEGDRLTTRVIKVWIREKKLIPDSDRLQFGKILDSIAQKAC